MSSYEAASGQSADASHSTMFPLTFTEVIFLRLIRNTPIVLVIYKMTFNFLLPFFILHNKTFGLFAAQALF